MKTLVATALATLGTLTWVALETNPALSQVNVGGYTNRNGTYVEPHQRSAPDDIRSNNYSYPGNYNPNSGRTTGGGYGSGYGSNGSTQRGNSFGF